MPKVLWPNVDDFIPTTKMSYVDVHGILGACVKLSGVGSTHDIAPSNILFNGMHGMGKTLLAATLVSEMSKVYGKPIPMVVYDCSEDTRENKLKGNFTMGDGETPFTPGPFPSVIHLANQVGYAVLCAEEISALTPGAQKQFNAMTDWREGIYIAELSRNIRLENGAKIIVIGTMNPSAYGGVYTLNSDLRSRFDEFIVPPPTAPQEKKILKQVCPFASDDLIEKAIIVAKDSRTPTTDYKLSTRDLVALLRNIYKLDKELEVPLTLIVNKFEGTDRDVMIDKVDAAFGTKLKDTLARVA